jgi:hypothetical protein
MITQRLSNHHTIGIDQEQDPSKEVLEKRLTEGFWAGNGFWVKCRRMNSIAELAGWMGDWGGERETT